jgi:hypothetical protein
MKKSNILPGLAQANGFAPAKVAQFAEGARGAAKLSTF